MAVFIIVMGAALSLVSYQTPVYNKQQNYSKMNIQLRNAVAQLQLDAVNAGTGYYPGTDISDWPIGVTISNSNPVTACNTPSTYTYSSTCFDTLNIITTDPNTPAAHPDNGTFTLNQTTDCVITTTSPMYVYPNAGTTAATLAADYKSGDQLLLVDTGNSKLTTIKLTANGTTFTSGGTTGVKLVFSVTNADGTNSALHDPLGITTVSANTKLNVNYCSNDWIMRLQPVTYSVDTTDPSVPKLVRAQAGTTTVLAEQIIGFKIGAAAWNTKGNDDASTASDATAYSYVSSNNDANNDCSTQSSSPWGYCNQWWLIRSVQVSLIGRTTPVTEPTYKYRNGFDQGPYQIESVVTSINPRNLSMNNN